MEEHATYLMLIPASSDIQPGQRIGRNGRREYGSDGVGSGGAAGARGAALAADVECSVTDVNEVIKTRQKVARAAGHRRSCCSSCAGERGDVLLMRCCWVTRVASCNTRVTAVLTNFCENVLFSADHASNLS